MKKSLTLLLIIFLGIIFRFNNLNWDANHHLHPDERFLTMVGNAIKMPQNLKEYFNPDLSPLNPANHNYTFFVYGIFPILFNKVLAGFFNLDNYNDFTLLGRFLSGFFDLLIIFLVYKTGEILEKKYRWSNFLKYFAAFFYTIAVLPIQLSHFFAVDTFLNFFMFASFYFSLKYNYFSSEQAKRPSRETIDNSRQARAVIKNSSRQVQIVGKAGSRKAQMITYLFMSAIFFGLAMSSKINAIIILPLNLFILIVPNLFRNLKFDNVLNKFFLILGYLLISYFTLRLADPYIFSSANFFDLNLNEHFVASLKSLKSFEGKDIWYPPGIQWINKKPVIFSLVNLAFFGVGLFYFAFIILAIGLIINFFLSKKGKRVSIFKRGKSANYIVEATLFWILAFFLYQSTQFVKAMRYFIFIYPFLAILAAYGLNWVFKKILRPMFFFLLMLLLIWPVSFSSIYLRPVSRVTASEWIYQNLPDNSFILGESWDDPLPLFVENNFNKQFKIEQLPIFDPDTSEKWQKMNDLLRRADYYILSSNRGWGSITTVPEKYPKMSKFYSDLLSGKNQSYRLVKEFTSYPQLKIGNWKLEFADDWADESFTVYDHPKVLIFKNISKNN
ncbi:MAG: hypothetical protein QHH09_02300 [Microgenomates group bacterium]|nr:hypothetical protein [Microgenomates group bacterium]